MLVLSSTYYLSISTISIRSMDKECDEDIEKINETLLLFENFGTM